MLDAYAASHIARCGNEGDPRTPAKRAGSSAYLNDLIEQDFGESND